MLTRLVIYRLVFYLAIIVLMPGHLVAATINASSCSNLDVQTAINSASNGDTVIIPNGTCSWDTGISTSKQIKLQGQTKGSVKIQMGSGIDSWDKAVLEFTTGTSYSTEISNIEFWPNGGVGSYLTIAGSVTDKPPLIYDNKFSSTDSYQYFQNIRYERYGGGVIYNNVFQSLYNGDRLYLGSGNIAIKDGNGDASWSADSTMGTDDTDGLHNVYIEDNVYTNCAAFDSDDGSRIVFRHNTLNDTPMFSHGADTSWIGMRHIEIYDNTLVFHESGTWTLYDINGQAVQGSFPLNINRWYDQRGGTAVVTGNVVPDIASSDWGDKDEFELQIQQIDRDAGPDACCSLSDGEYPCYHQVGRGKNNALEPSYYWGNTGSYTIVATNSGYDQCSSMPHDDNPGYFIQASRDYYTTAKPDWEPYTYPHPLRDDASPDPATPGNAKLSTSGKPAKFSASAPTVKLITE